MEMRYWRAFLERDGDFDGLFYLAVKTTGVFCRPSCPARRPKRENVIFFRTSGEAKTAGFRACKRCGPDDPGAVSAGAKIVLKACELIDADVDGIPSLQALEEQLDVSRYHLLRVFKKLLGITPRQYADAQRVESLKTELRDGRNVADAIYGAGYGSSSRVYEKSSEQLGMTPDQYRRGGSQQNIGYTIVESSLGTLLLAATARGICRIRLGEAKKEMTAALRQEFHSAVIERDDKGLKVWVEEVLARIDGHTPSVELPSDVRATAFQRRVWEELRSIPFGEIRTYSDVAAAIGRPRAVRAVANACAGNPVAIVVPCHRVVRKDGTIGGYRWGVDRKEELLSRESKKSPCSERT
ncbi:MAG TPA: bifunctional DNA-binding transcriptional regulator/O6-methylguanine-DNA methyltransferase Ada [Acidobacteriota bacterium]|nr:bifunctional DNA-binding transcriptional regulator/O6-methylguanine-DNA methyltransferase Ada [Acidobacteriota bacterium]